MRPVTDVLHEGIVAGQFGEPIEPHGHHAMGFFQFSGIEALLTEPIVDIGSGAGLPALPLAEAYPETHWSLIERRDGRCALLRRAVRRLGLSDRVNIHSSEVTQLAWDSSLRATAGIVTARSFGSPADTAECATGFLRPGGVLITSEPESVRVERWPDEGLQAAGLQFVDEWRTTYGFYRAFERLDVKHALPRRSARKTEIF